MTNQQFMSEMDRLENILFSFALRLTRNYEDAQDLMQETIFRAYKHREKFAHGHEFQELVIDHNA